MGLVSLSLWFGRGAYKNVDAGRRHPTQRPTSAMQPVTVSGRLPILSNQLWSHQLERRLARRLHFFSNHASRARYERLSCRYWPKQFRNFALLINRIVCILMRLLCKLFPPPPIRKVNYERSIAFPIDEAPFLIWKRLYANWVWLRLNLHANWVSPKSLTTAFAVQSGYPNESTDRPPSQSHVSTFVCKFLVASAKFMQISCSPIVYKWISGSWWLPPKNRLIWVLRFQDGMQIF